MVVWEMVHVIMYLTQICLPQSVKFIPALRVTPILRHFASTFILASLLTTLISTILACTTVTTILSFFTTSSTTSWISWVDFAQYLMCKS